MKKHITLILAIIATLCLSMFFVACGEPENNNPTPEAPSVTVDINKSNVNMILGTTENLTAMYTTKDGYTLSWSSSDSSIVTVNGGKLEAMKQGNVTVTATYSNGTETVSDTCNVAVTLGNFAPVFCIENNTLDSWNVTKGESIEIVPYVYFNGMKFYDVTVTLESSNNDIVSFENNTITALAKGSANIQLAASWRGIEFNGKNAMGIDLKYNVFGNYEMSSNGETLKDIHIYTRESWGGKTYATTAAFDPVVRENNEVSTNPVEIVIANETIIKYSNEGYLYTTGEGFGETTITLNWTSSDGDPYTKIINAKVERPVDYFAETIEYFSAIDGVALYDADKDGAHLETTLADVLYGAGTDAVMVDGYQNYYNYANKSDIVADALTVTDNVVNGVFSHASGFQDVELTLGTNTEVWVVNIKSASKVFAQDNIDEFVPTFTTTVNEGKGYTLYLDGGVIDKYLYYTTNSRRQGYYTLCEDITGIETNGKNTGAMFAGNFDGRGHVISDITFTGYDDAKTETPDKSYSYWGGLFGTLKTIADAGITNQGAIIQNVAFTDVTFAAPNCSLLGYQSNGTSSGLPTIRNVFAQFNEQAEYQNWCSALFYMSQYLKMENVIVDYPVGDNYVLPTEFSYPTPTEKDPTATTSNNYGSLIARMDYTKYTKRQILSNVYVVSKVPLGFTNNGTDEELWKQDASNVTAEGFLQVPGTYRYNTYADMKAANNDYAGFTTDYWTIVDGLPVFNALA